MQCKNCDRELISGSTFCSHCGARVIRNRLTIANLFSHFSETFLNYDNKFLKTIVTLVTDPVDVIDGFINGVRKKYMSPLGFFAIILSISGFYLLFIQKFAPELMQFEAIYKSELQQRFTDESMKLVMEYNSLMYSLFIPIITLMSYVIFIDKRYNFTEH